MKAKKKLLMWPWCVRLRGQGRQKGLCRVLDGFWGFWVFLEGFEGFWQTAGLNASKKLLMAPWRPRKSCWCGLSALACGVKSAKKAFGGFWRVLKGLKPGKQQAWTPVKSYWWHLEGQEKAVYVALVRSPAGSRVPKKPLEGKQQAWTRVTSYWGRFEGQENKRHAWAPCDETAKFHTFGGPRRRPGLSEGRGRRIFWICPISIDLRWFRCGTIIA